MNPLATDQTEPGPKGTEPIQGMSPQQPQGIQINMAELSKLFGENQALKKAHRRHAWVQFMTALCAINEGEKFSEIAILADSCLAEYDARTNDGRL